MEILQNRLRYMPLFWLSGAFLLGLLAGARLGAGWLLWLGVAACLGILTAVEIRLKFFERWRRLSPLPAAVLLATACLGAARYQAAQPATGPENLVFYNGMDALHMQGVVDAVPQQEDLSLRLRLRVDSLIPPGETSPRRVSGTVLIFTGVQEDWQYGDRVEVYGALQTPPEQGDFSYRDYLARRGIHSVVWQANLRLVSRGSGNPILRAIYSLRLKAYAVVNHILPQPEAALLSGILLGIEDDLPDSLMDAYQKAGTAHIIAISGFNISVVAGLLTGLSSHITRRRGLALGLATAGILLYTVLAGAGAPVVRAAVMGTLSMLGRHFGRRQSGENILMFSAAVMCLFNPMLPWDASFQLSFCATLGLVLYASPLQEGFTSLLQRRLPVVWANRIAAPVGEVLLVTLAAQLTTFPIISYHFQRVSLVSLPANLLVLPPQPLIMLVGGSAVLVGLVFLPLGQVLGWLVYPLLAFSNIITRSLAALSWADAALHTFSWPAVLAYFGLLFLISLPLLRPGFALKPRSVLQRLTPPLLAGSALMAVFFWRVSLPHYQPSGEPELQLVWMDLEGGPALLLQSPGGSTLLLNGSSSPRDLSARLGQFLSPLQRSPDVLLLTTLRSQTIEGIIPVIEDDPSQMVLWSPPAAATPAGRRIMEILTAAGSAPVPLESGQKLVFESGLQMQILDSSTRGTALLMEWRDFRAFLPGGIPLKELLALPSVNLKGVSLLLLQDEDMDSPQEWEILDARAVICCGDECGRAGSGAGWVMLPANGWLSAESDGTNLRLATGQ